MWGRMISCMICCAPVAYWRCSGVDNSSGRLTIGRRLTTCPTAACLHHKKSLDRATTRSARPRPAARVRRSFATSRCHVPHLLILHVVCFQYPSKSPETFGARAESHICMRLIEEWQCPKCGAEMEPIETTVDQFPLQAVRLCPNCYLVSWLDSRLSSRNAELGRQFQQGVPVPRRARPRGEC